MRVSSLLGLCAVLSLGSGAVIHSHSFQKEWDGHVGNMRRLIAREQPLLNTTRPASSTQPPITSDPKSSLPISTTITTVRPSTSAPAAQSTISNGETVIAIIGATYVVGVGGAILMVGGTPHSLATGTVVTITGGGLNGDTPEIETVSYPNRTQEPRTSDPASHVSSALVTPTLTSSASPTSSHATSSSAAVPTPYIVLFSQNATEEQIKAVNSMLNTDASPNSLTAVTSDRSGLVVFFKAGISPAQADAISQEPGVSGVFVDETLDKDQPPSSAMTSSASRHPTATGPPGSPQTSVPNPPDIRLQSDAVDELKVISQPAGAALLDLPGYVYANEGGKGVAIYTIDTGSNAQNSEWSSMPGTKSFMYAPGATQDETDFMNHGSCVASKAGGPEYGTAKDADMIAVKLPQDLSISAVFAALIEISNDVFQKKLEGKAVINMSLGSRIPASVTDAYQLLLVALMAEDIVIVTASGNDAQYGVDDVTLYPALFGPTTDIIVVGAVDNEGYRTFFSQGTAEQLTVSAPGFVSCADGRTTGSQELYGTSFAAPAVAGVIAVWLSQDEHRSRLQVSGQVAANVKQMVQELAYSRVEGEPAVIWNGIDPRGLVCPTNAHGKRQAQPSGRSGSCQATSAASSVVSTNVPVSTPAPPSPPPSTTTSTPPPPPPPPTPKTLFSLEDSIGAGTKSCFPTTGFVTSPGTTYGFSFDVDANLLVSIETGATDEGYHQSMGSWTGTFYAESGSSLSICGQSSGGDLSLKFTITEAPSEAVKAPTGKELLQMDENLSAGVTSCFPTTGLNIQQGNYGFSYATSDGVLVQIGDDSSGPKYFSGNKAAGAGLMYIDFSGGSISVCATNTGGGSAALSVSITQ